MTPPVSDDSTDGPDDEMFEVSVSRALSDRLHAKARQLDVPVGRVIRSILQQALPLENDDANGSEKNRPSPSASSDQDATERDDPETTADTETVPRPEDLLPRDFNPNANADGNTDDGDDAQKDLDTQERGTVMDMLTSARGRLDALTERDQAAQGGKERRMLRRLAVIRARMDDRISLAPLPSPSPSRIRKALQRPDAFRRQGTTEGSSSDDGSPASMFEVLDED